MPTLREQILAADDIRKVPMEVPEWDVTVEIRSLTAAERMALLDTTRGPDGEILMSKLYPAILVATLFDPEDGLPVFSDSDLAAINTKAGDIVERVAAKAMQVVGMTTGDTDSNGAPISQVDAEGKAS